MSTNNIITSVEAPEGFEAYLDDGVVRFRPATPPPSPLRTTIWFSTDRFAFDEWTGSRTGWQKRVTPAAPYADNPTVRNVRHRRVLSIAVEHEQEEFVQAAVGLLMDYIDNILPSATEDEVGLDERGA